MLELVFLKVLMLIRQVCQKYVLFLTFGMIYIKGFVMLCDISKIAVLTIDGVDYCSTIFRICLSETINLLKNDDLIEKGRLLWDIKTFCVQYKRWMSKYLCLMMMKPKNKTTSHYSRDPIGISSINIDKVLISNKILSGKHKGFKYFFGDEGDDKVK